MSKRVTVLSVSVCAVLLAATGVGFLLWPEGSAAEDRERDFCWGVSARVSSGEAGKGGSVSACAVRLEKAAEKDRAALRTEVSAYGRHTAKSPDAMPVPVRRALSRALAERPGLVLDSLAPIGPRKSGATRPYLGREALLATVRAVAEDDAALRTVRTSQETYVRSRIATLTRADFDKGEDSRRAVTVSESVGRVTGTLTALAHSARPDATRAERVDYYARHGYPRISDQFEEHARAVGVPQSDIEDLASPLTDLRSKAETAYLQAADAFDVS